MSTDSDINETRKAQQKKATPKKQRVFLVVDCFNSPGKVYAVFADEKSATDFCDRYHPDEAEVERRTLLHGQQTSAKGYIR